MIHHFVQFALRQGFLVLMLVFLVVVAGALSFQRMPVDAYPDLSPPMVEVITQWPGHAAEEIERLITLPIEVEMNGVPHMQYLRSISLYGLSDVIMTFQESTDDYFARNVVFQRLTDAQLPSGVSPSLAPLSSPSGLVYRYVLESQDRTPQQLKTLEDWVIERAYRSVPGVADDSGFGGTVMQYQVLLDPAKIYNYHIPMPQVLNALAANNSNAGGGFYTQGSQFFYVRGLGLVTKTEDIGNIVVSNNNGVPVRIRDIGEVTIGNAPRLGEFGFQKNDDSVEGMIQAGVGGQAATQVIQGERLFDLVVRMKPQYRSSTRAIGNLLVPTPSGTQVPISELATVRQGNGASFIYRENNSRYIGVQFSIEGRDLARAVDEARSAMSKTVALPQGYRLNWGGEYSEYLAASEQFAVIGPLALLLIFMILFALYGNLKFPLTVMIGVVMTEPVGALLALKLTHTTFSVSSVLGLLVLLGVSAETAIIDVSYINKMRLEGQGIRQATLDGSLVRLRPIMMTALVACLGLLPAALSTGIGSDSQKPFAIVIVAGLVSRLFLGRIVSPVLYQMVAKPGDVLQV
jgi:Cu/Ag efflux pump CusA